MLCLWLVFAGAEDAAAQVLDTARGFEDGCKRPPPPPGSAVTYASSGPVVLARYFGATNAYAHGVLGDTTEATGVLVRYENNDRVICDTVIAGPDRVFEDTSPRLVDVTGDGMAEAIAVAAHDRLGARLEIYGYPAPGQDFQLLAATPYIGTRFRWLGVVGAADLDKDGQIEIAYIDRPHLAKTLRIWRYTAGELRELVSRPGLTNHRIGWDFIAGGIRDCGAGPEMVLADAGWTKVVAVRLKDTDLNIRDVAPYAGPETMARAMEC